MKSFNPFLLLWSFLTVLINPANFGSIGASVTVVAGSTKSGIQTLTTGATVDGDEVISVHEIIEAAAQDSPFADNMTGALGSGKPIVLNTDASRVIGTTIVIPTVESLGAPVVRGATERSGAEEQMVTGDFLLKVGIGWFGVGIDNTGKAQTILGLNWDDLTKRSLARRLAKQQSDETMQAFKADATSDNTVFPGGKSMDTLGTGDTYSLAFVVKSGGVLRDIGARPINARPLHDQSPDKSIKIARHLQFTTDALARPIKTDTSYLQGMQLARDRGMSNNLFTGDYSDIDNQIIYPFQTVRHGAYGSIGCPLQPEAKLGVALTASDTMTALTIGSATGAALSGGGNSTAAAATPLRNYFENWSRFTYPSMNAVTHTYTPGRATYSYVGIVNGTTGLIALFSYTTNLGYALTVCKQLSDATATDSITATLSGSSMTYGTAPWTTTADGLGFLGLYDPGSGGTATPAGSMMYELNSKGVPVGYGLGLGEMAAVCGYGRVPGQGGVGFKTMAQRTKWEEPHGRAFSDGLEVSWGCAPFVRPDGKQPNYVLQVFARKVDGFPVIT